MSIKKTLIAAAGLLFAFGITASATTMELTMNDPTVNILADGEIVSRTIEAAPFTLEDRTMVPVRIISETFGCEVGWDEAIEGISISKEGKEITLKIGSNLGYINGEEVSLDVAPVEISGRSFVPLRFISENLGYNVDYAELTDQVIICDKPNIMSVNGKEINYSLYEFIMMLNCGGKEYSAEEQQVISAFAYDTLAKTYAISLTARENGITYNKEDYLSVIDDTMNESEVKLLKGSCSLFFTELGYYNEFAEKARGELEEIPAPTEEEVISAYTEENFKGAKLIYFSPDSKEDAEQAYKTVSANPSKFEEVMKEKSEDKYFEDYPDGIFIDEINWEKEVFEAIQKLNEGEISSLIATENGYYILMRVALPELREEDKWIVEDFVYSKKCEKINNKYVVDIKAEQHFSPNDALNL